MRTRDLVIVGAVMPLVLGGSLGMIETSDGKGTWAYPMEPTAFLLLSIGLAISHLLVLLVYVALGTRSDGLVSTFSPTRGRRQRTARGVRAVVGLEAPHRPRLRSPRPAGHGLHRHQRARGRGYDRGRNPLEGIAGGNTAAAQRRGPRRGRSREIPRVGRLGHRRPHRLEPALHTGGPQAAGT